MWEKINEIKTNNNFNFYDQIEKIMKHFQVKYLIHSQKNNIDLMIATQCYGPLITPHILLK